MICAVIFQVGIFWVGTFRREISAGGSWMSGVSQGGNFPGGNFLRIVSSISYRNTNWLSRLDGMVIYFICSMWGTFLYISRCLCRKDLKFCVLQVTQSNLSYPKLLMTNYIILWMSFLAFLYWFKHAFIRKFQRIKLSRKICMFLLWKLCKII